MRINYYADLTDEQSLDQQRDALAGAARADTTSFRAALAAQGPASFAIDKRSGEQVKLYRAISDSGNVQRVSVFSDAGERNNVGSMSVAPSGGTLRILTIESHERSRYKGIGTAMLDIADRIRDSAGLSSLSLISQDEGASEFFYKKGFRFTGQRHGQKNSEMRHHISDPRYVVPDDVILIGDMERPS
ncbi:GNAT family N-acetyltransferase [Bradyrhizobium glycinis]|uniref:GNAT family N-acetyltransferase n=1 Tax=Bradyrhizobium glycinis TaxID=2751812 RepID=UPI0018D86A7E|nr:GNAT family N-acetyltransferase [Bradyrhizobium glycinis]MBH5372236.1 hypothetical protein [Bradyrhizobium glycinis]